MKRTIAALLPILLLLASCAGTPGLPQTPPQDNTPAGTAAGTTAPGDFTLESIVEGAERHMPVLAFCEIPADELKSLYPGITAQPVEIRGRRAADGTEYLVMAAANGRDMSFIKDADETLEADAAIRAEALGLEYRITAGDYNKYAAVMLSKKDTQGLLLVLCNAFTGSYITGSD